jgi:hypothetical protein
MIVTERSFSGHQQRGSGGDPVVARAWAHRMQSHDSPLSKNGISASWYYLLCWKFYVARTNTHNNNNNNNNNNKTPWL